MFAQWAQDSQHILSVPEQELYACTARATYIHFDFYPEYRRTITEINLLDFSMWLQANFDAILAHLPQWMEETECKE